MLLRLKLLSVESQHYSGLLEKQGEAVLFISIGFIHRDRFNVLYREVKTAQFKAKKHNYCKKSRIKDELLQNIWLKNKNK